MEILICDRCGSKANWLYPNGADSFICEDCMDELEEE